MTDPSGTVVWSADYKPFGEATITVTTITNNLWFPGQYFDSETGLHYNYYRDYNPAIGRYVEADPVGIDEGENHLFTYVNNNPILRTDPTGEMAAVAGAIAGGAAAIGGVEAAAAAAAVLVAYCATHPDDCKDLTKIRCKAEVHKAHHPFGWPFNRKMCHVQVWCFKKGVRESKFLEFRIPIPCCS